MTPVTMIAVAMVCSLKYRLHFAIAVRIQSSDVHKRHRAGTQVSS